MSSMVRVPAKVPRRRCRSAEVELLGLPTADGPVEHQTRADDAREQAHGDADDERDGEALDGAAAVLGEDQSRDERRDVPVEDGAERLVVADVDGSARALALA